MDAANLSLSGTTLDVTTALHPSYIAVASRVAQVMDLRFCGIDVLAKDATRPDDEYVVLEINSAPGLDNYLYRGRKNTICRQSIPQSARGDRSGRYAITIGSLCRLR